VRIEVRDPERFKLLADILGHAGWFEGPDRRPGLAEDGLCLAAGLELTTVGGLELFPATG
jgi:hypothetical protein